MCFPRLLGPKKSYVKVSGQKWRIFATKKCILLHIYSKMGPVKPYTAALEAVDVQVEPRAAPQELVAAPADKGSSPSEASVLQRLQSFRGSSPSEAPEACLSPGALSFLLAALSRYQISIMPGRRACSDTWGTSCVSCICWMSCML